MNDVVGMNDVGDRNNRLLTLFVIQGLTRNPVVHEKISGRNTFRWIPVFTGMTEVT